MCLHHISNSRHVFCYVTRLFLVSNVGQNKKWTHRTMMCHCILKTFKQGATGVVGN